MDDRSARTFDAQDVVAPKAVDAVVEGGLLRPLAPLNLPDGTVVSLTIAPAAPPATLSGESEVPTSAPPQLLSAPPAASAPPADSAPRIDSAVGQASFLELVPAPPPAAPPPAAPPPRVGRLELALLALAVLTYLVTRFVGIERYPIYFFSDEAVQANAAAELIDRGWRDADGVLLPTYFRNSDKWSLSLTVYMQTIPVMLVGKSVLATRGVAALFSLLAGLALALALRRAFANRLWWAAPLLLATMPSWFIHSRTAFETSTMVACYAAFLCCYLLYRAEQTRWIYPALLFGAGTFYSYANGQGVMLISGALLLLDAPYHWRQRHTIWPVVGWLALLSAPYVRFRLQHPEAIGEQLRNVDSVWVSDLPFAEKLRTFLGNYAYGLSPNYWFFPNESDLARHRMPDIAHIPTVLLPLALIGLGICLWRWRSAAHRVVLVALLAAPFSAAIAAIFVTRALAMVVPLTLLILIGADAVIGWAIVRWPAVWRRWPLISAGIGLALVAMSLSLLRVALVSGPLFFPDYGFYGMQYGGSQVFGAVKQGLADDSQRHYFISPNWANNADSLGDFFLTPQERKRIQFGGLEPYLDRMGTIDPQQVFLVIPEEYQTIVDSKKFAPIQPLDILPLPDGRPGFYLLKLAYLPNAADLFTAEAAERAKPVVEQLTIDGVPTMVSHSLFDGGRIENLIDGDPFTLARGYEANPLLLDFSFATPRALSGLRLTTATMNFTVTATLTPVSGDPIVVTKVSRDGGRDPTVEIPFPGGPLTLRDVRLEIVQENPDTPAHVHIRELVFE